MSNPATGSGVGGALAGYGPRTMPVVTTYNLAKATTHEEAGRWMTKTLATIFRHTRVINDEIKAFEVSQCYNDQVSSVKFSAVHYIDVASYYVDVFTHTTHGTGEMTRDYQIPTAFRDPDAAARQPVRGEYRPSTIADLVAFTEAAVDDLGAKLDSFKLTVSASISGTESLLFLARSKNMAPSVSPREILFWCLLNTRSYRREVQEAASGNSPESAQRLTELLGKTYVRVAYMRELLTIEVRSG